MSLSCILMLCMSPWMIVIFYLCTFMLIMFTLKFTNTDRCSVQKEHHWFKWIPLCYGSNGLCLFGLICPICLAYIIFIPLQRTGTHLVYNKMYFFQVIVFKQMLTFRFFRNILLIATKSISSFNVKMACEWSLPVSIF